MVTLNSMKPHRRGGTMRLFYALLLVGFVSVLAFSLTVASCASKRKEVVELQLTDETVLEPSETPTPTAETPAPASEPQEKSKKRAKPERLEEAKAPKEKPPQKVAISEVPSYDLFADSLRYYERKYGIEFYKNKKGKYAPFAASSWTSFSIADKHGQCLFDVEVVGLQKFRTTVLLEMDISRGPCGLKYPEADPQAVERVSIMEGSVVSQELVSRVKRTSLFCSDKRFLQKVLQVPFDLDFGGSDLELSLQKVAEQIANPMDVSFGDIVFFDSYPNERSVGIYVGYGAIVYSTCFGAKIHQISAKNKYRVYRIFTGFAWTQYKLHQGKFMQDYLEVPK